jgi:lipoprotein-anchoring transpeptidase ErfK/SrfK
MKVFSQPWLTGLLAGALLAGSSFAASAGDMVGFSSGYRAGSIVIITHQRELYYVLGEGRAIRYPVGVGKAGMAWQGHARVKEKFLRPAWSPPDDIWRANPAIPGVIPPGDPRNPMGAAAMGLDHGNYGIHGTNNPDSVGRFVSHGCIRMHNADIMDLYRRTPVGTDVFVLP